jgi:transposase
MQMSKTRKNYPASFKTKVVISALREDVPVSELALKYGVHAKVIHRWKKEAVASMEAGFSGKLEVQKNDHASEVKELHAKIGQLSVERDFLVDVSNRLGLGGDRKW